jgi:hypothetical protein
MLEHVDFSQAQDVRFFHEDTKGAKGIIRKFVGFEHYIIRDDDDGNNDKLKERVVSYHIHTVIEILGHFFISPPILLFF